MLTCIYACNFMYTSGDYMHNQIIPHLSSIGTKCCDTCLYPKLFARNPFSSPQTNVNLSTSYVRLSRPIRELI